MQKITIITGKQACGTVEVTVREDGEKTVYTLPVGVEIAVSDALAQAVVKQCACPVGYIVRTTEEADALPTDGIADGSYCFVITTGEIRFLADGSWR